MKRLACLSALVMVTVAACDAGDPSAGDAGGGEVMDAGPADAGPPVPCEGDAECPGSYCNRGTMLCCRPAVPSFEICGDRIDQDCNGEDQSCGDNDRDGVQACRPGEDPIGGTCDCNDSRADVRPGFGALPGAPEACDGVDNDCNGRTDEASQCCDACASLGTARNRADICTVDGVCDCSTDAASGPCAEGLTCCASGCVDTQTDIANCGFCNAQCTVSADRCEAGACACGAGGTPCDLDGVCSDGTCPE